MQQALRWAPILLGLVFLLALASLTKKRALNGENDFVAFYTAAKLAGGPDLYDRAANLAQVKSILGFNLETVVYIRPPFYAAILKPLAYFPYRTAYLIFSILTLSSILFFVLCFEKECPGLSVFAATSIPFLSVLVNGQDTPFLLTFIGGAILFERRGRHFLAGLLFSLCAIKFHLFVFLPLLWVLKKQWRVLAGAASGASILTVAGLIVAGFESIPKYIQVLRDPWINASATVMPNLHGLATTMGGGAPLEAFFAILVIGTFLWLNRCTGNYELLFAVCLVCGLLLSFHSGIADCVLLYPAFVLVLRVSQNVPLRVASALILCPLPYFMALADAPYSAALPLSLLGLLGLFCWSLRDTKSFNRLGLVLSSRAKKSMV